MKASDVIRIGRSRRRAASIGAARRSWASNTAVFAFVLAVVFVFLVLAAQYESMRGA
jgi:multidrug efflux pump subunit AcrB